jgi:hypothetical protein
LNSGASHGARDQVVAAWNADMPMLQARAEAALDPHGPPLSLAGYGSVEHATEFEGQCLKD